MDGAELNIMSSKAKGTDTCDDLIISENNKVIQAYGFIMIVFALISTLLATFYACFGPPETTFAKVVDIIMEVCFGIDIIRHFFMEFKDDEEGGQRRVRNLKSIAKRYLKGDFLVDFIAISRIFWVEIFKDSWTDDQVDLFYLLRLFRLYKVLFLLNT